MATYRLSIETTQARFFEDYDTRLEADEAMKGLQLESGSKQGFAVSKNGGFSVAREHIVGAQINEIGDPVSVPTMPWNPMGDGWE